MRVIAGTARRLQLKTVKGDATRPTTDRIKETLFNILNPDLPGCHFLDLFSGSGAIAIEALSRGAKHAVLVDNNKQAAICIKDNLAHTKLADQALLMTQDVLTAIHILSTKKESFDFIFMDPPYDLGIEPDVLNALANSNLVHSDTVIIIEAALKKDFSYIEEDYPFEITRIKEYKTNKHLFLQYKGE